MDWIKDFLKEAFFNNKYIDNLEKYTQLIKQKAYDLGFMFCGISKAGYLEEEAPRFEKWLKEGKQGNMTYMENNFEKRLNPKLLVDGAESIVSLALNYFPEKQQQEETFKLSKYAYGEDYHFVIKYKLKELMKYIHQEIGEVGGRVFVDSAPVMDKAWAKKSGIGWMGKNANLIHPKSGSFFFLAELIIDLKLNYDSPIKDYCGTCTACIEDCPTGAIVEPYVVDGSKCISYLTIELKDEIIPKEFQGKMEDWMFGCDICQDVCPWNRFSSSHNEPLFNPSPKLLGLSKKDWEDLTEEIFRDLFKKSAVKRTKFKGLKRNIDFTKLGKVVVDE